MLNILEGRSGSGKTTYALNVLEAKARKGQNKNVLIVPEQFSFASERTILEHLGAKDAQNIEVLSFTRLADFVFKTLGGLAGTQADDGRKIILMLRTLEAQKDNLTLYSKHISSVSLCTEMLHTISELKQEKITPEMLETASLSTSLKTFSLKLHELSLIYATYEAMLTVEYVDDSSVLDKLCGKLASNNFFEGYTIVIDAFKGFTGQEYAVIDYLIRQADNVYVTLCTKDIYLKDPSMIWEAVNDTGHKLVSLAKKNNVEVSFNNKFENGKRFSSPALKFLEENIFYPVNRNYSEKTDDITIVTSNNMFDECNFIAASARKLMREDKIRCRDIAVIVRNDDSYKRELISAFNRYSIPVFEDSRAPIMNQPLITLVKSVLEIMCYGFSTENILHYLKTGLSTITESDVAQLENYALLWDLKSNAWQNDFTLNPSGLGVELKESDKVTLQKLNHIRKSIISPLITLKGKTKDATSKQISTALFEFIDFTKVKETLKEYAKGYNDAGLVGLAVEQNRIWEILMDELDKLASTYGETLTDIKTYYNLFCAVISVTDLGNIPHGLDEISIGSADRIRLLSPKVVFVAGCAEGVFPATISTGGILTSMDRKNLEELGIEISLPSSVAASEERYIAYTSLTASTDKLFVSYHRMGGPGDAYLPSIIYENIKELFAGSIKEIDTEFLPFEYFSETSSSVFAQYARTESPELRESLNGLESYKDKIKTLDDIRTKKPFKIENRDIATELFGKDMFLSASRIDVYHKCAFEYFCKFGIKAMPRGCATLDPAQSGTVIHYVLENIIKEFGKDKLIAMTDKEKSDAVDLLLSKYLKEKMGGFDDKTLRFKYLYNRLKVTLLDVVSRLCAEFSVCDFTPVDFELKIGGQNAEIDYYTLTLSDGSVLKINGSVDRVDKYEKDGKTYIRVVDYKSGGKEFTLSDILAGLNMQMLIYLFAIEANGGEKYGDVVPAGILYYPAKKSSISLKSRNITADNIEKEKIKSDRGSGLFLLDGVTLNAMEHDLGGKFLPITNNKDTLKGNLITLQNMGLLRTRMDEIMKEMVESLHSGEIPAKPAFGKNYKTTCQYCDYFPICGFEDGDPKIIDDLSNDDVFKVLEGGEIDG